MKSKITKLYRDLEGKCYAVIDIACDYMDTLKALKDKDVDVDIKKYSERRSLDANAALWKLLDMMSAKVGKNKDALYLEMLADYGVFTHIIVKKNAVEKFKQEYKLCKELGEVNINGKKGIQLQCYFGSSTYNKEEFSKLLNGVVEEAKLLGIYLISEQEKELLLSKWGKK